MMEISAKTIMAILRFAHRSAGAGLQAVTSPGRQEVILNSVISLPLADLRQDIIQITTTQEAVSS